MARKGPAAERSAIPFYGNHAFQRGGAGGGEVNLQESNGVTVNKNIMQATVATQSGWNGTTTTSGKVYAIASVYSWPNVIFTNNDYFGVNGQHYCDYSDAGGGCNRNSQYRPTFGAGNVNVDVRIRKLVPAGPIQREKPALAISGTEYKRPSAR